MNVLRIYYTSQTLEVVTNLHLFRQLEKPLGKKAFVTRSLCSLGCCTIGWFVTIVLGKQIDSIFNGQDVQDILI